MFADSVARKTTIIICLARSLEKIRIIADWGKALEAGRLLLISPFQKRPRRPTVESSQQRNEFVAALTDEVLIIYTEPGGSIERILSQSNAGIFLDVKPMISGGPL